MNFKILQFTFLMVSYLTFGFNVIIAQETSYFIDKPDKNIKKIIKYSVDTEKDTSYLDYVVEYNKSGQLIKESQPEVHIHIDYEYDKKGRLQKKEALYGESFANGITTYEYIDGSVIEKNLAMGFYSETRNEFDKIGRLNKTSTFYVAGGMGESKIETIVYEYNMDNQVSKKSINIEYYNYEVEPGEVPEMKTEYLISKLKAAKLGKKNHFVEKYKYDSAKNMIQVDFLNDDKNELQYYTTYQYNNSGLLTKEHKVCVKPSGNHAVLPCEETKTERKYNAKNQLESITTKGGAYSNINFYKEGRLVSSSEKYSSNLSYKYTYKYEYYKE